MSFPKMLYRTEAALADHEAVKSGLASGIVKTLVVASAAEQAKAKGWLEDLGALVKKVEAKIEKDVSELL